MSLVTRLLNTRVEVWRTTTQPDGAGGEVTTLGQVATHPAMVSQPTAMERMLADQGQSRQTHVIYFPVTADVRRGDELHRDSQVFRVLSVFQPSRPIYLRADVELYQHG